MLKVDTSNPVNHSDRYQAMFAGELACPSILGSNHVLCLILMAARHGEPYQVRGERRALANIQACTPRLRRAREV